MMPHHSEHARELIAACARYGICTDAGTDIFHLERNRVRHRSCLIVPDVTAQGQWACPGFLISATWEYLSHEKRMGLWVALEAGSIRFASPILPDEGKAWENRWYFFDDRKYAVWTGTLELEPVP